MADNHSKDQRSYNMSKIRSKDNKPEDLVRKYLFSKGFRYRKNVRKLPGCPDIVLPKYNTVIFVNGCFWHKHDCPRFVWPSSNHDLLRLQGWNVIVVWECELKKSVREKRLERLINEIISNQHGISG